MASEMSDPHEQRLSNVEGRVTDLEGRLTDVRIGMERLHGDLRVNTDKAEQIRASVAKIQSDTAEMISVYRATPQIRASVRFWIAFAAALWALVMAAATLIGALR